MLNYMIEANDHLRRADSFLRNLMPGAPLSYLRKVVAAGHLKVNALPAEPARVLLVGDEVTLKESGKTAALIAPTRFPDILYEDTWIVSFNKPAGLAVHRTEDPREPDLVTLGERFLAQHGDAVKLRPVNRLDKGTSGAIIMAKNGVAAGMFGRMVKEEGLGKLYLALVQGSLQEEGLIDLPLEGKESQTGYRLLLQGRDGALAAVRPLTGRMHQIRQHLRALGRPIFGDRRYGGSVVSGFTGHALHSFATTLTHPATGEDLTIPAPVGAAFVQLAAEVTGVDPLEILKELRTAAEAAPF